MADKRNIFEDVTAEKPQVKPGQKPGPTPGMIDAGRAASRHGIRIWLHILLGLVALMIVIGGLTRLTDSGLSITEWKPVMGAWPPTSQPVWMQEFAKYQMSPEYQLQNKGMSLKDFQFIYWWEWSHRQLGRLIGLVWAIGFFWFLARRQIPAGWTLRLFGLGVLGGLQGAIGWWMVASGLTGRMVDVASYRLATHLGLAFVIMGLISWYSMRLKRDERALLQARRSRDAGLARWAGILGGLVFFQILLGALVAGIDAGRGYIDWPLMNGAFLPSESFDYQPLWTNFFENPALVQFDHRMVGYLVFAVAGMVWWFSRKSPLRAVKTAFDFAFAMVFLQMILGIATVLYAAPVHIAIVHQIGAIATFVLILRARFLALYPAQQSLR